MKCLNLKRISKNDYGVYGTFILNYQPICQSFELPWMDNKRRISCIPSGLYKVSPHISPHFGPCYHINDVQDRNYVLIHPGNIDDDTKGCILPGLMYGDVWSKEDQEKEYGVQHSRTAMDRLRAALGRENDFGLKIWNFWN